MHWYHCWCVCVLLNITCWNNRLQWIMNKIYKKVKKIVKIISVTILNNNIQVLYSFWEQRSHVSTPLIQRPTTIIISFLYPIASYAIVVTWAWVVCLICTGWGYTHQANVKTVMCDGPLYWQALSSSYRIIESHNKKL